ncbi:ARM repeat-containing protein, partial [Neoconidiobolus thromboides FSU 785]
NLKSKSEDTRNKAGDVLREFYDEVSQDCLPSTFAEIERDINIRITDLIKKITFPHKVRYINSLKLALPCNDEKVMILAAKTLGKLAVSGEITMTTHLEGEIKKCIEWLQSTERFESRRHAAVLMIKEISQSAPTLMYEYVSSILDSIWVALRDIKINIRVSGSEALTSCLKIILQRESQHKKAWYSKILEGVQKGLKMNTLESIHGSFLALKELLIDSGMFMKEYYQEACEIVLRYKDHRELLIRNSVVSLIPLLASYNPKEFSEHYLQKIMLFLLTQLQKEKERVLAFSAIGEVSIAVGNKITPFVDSIVQNIKESLANKSIKGKGTAEAPVFHCISNLSSAAGPSLSRHSTQLLDLIFSYGMHDSLHQTLVDLVHNIPSLLIPIQSRLLNSISIILSGQQYIPPGAPNQRQSSNVTTIRDYSTIDPNEIETIIMALNSLGSFDFSGHLLSEFVRDCLLSFLDWDDVEVRKSAALTCCKILLKDPVCYQTSMYAIEVMNEILVKLLSAGIADPEFEVRQTVLSNLQDNFNLHLSQANNIRYLFMALSDEVFTIRKTAMAIIGRLSNHNPAYIVPSLRKILIQLLTNLEYSDSSRIKEESAILISILVKSAQSFVKPYIQPIVDVLQTKVHNTNPSVVASVLKAIGELAQVGGEQLTSYLDNMMPLIIDTLQDQSSILKRNAALKTLGQLTGNTGYVIDPYIKYPNLLGILVGILKREQSNSIRRETIKVMGILGALDPYQHKMDKPESEEPIGGNKDTSTDLHLVMMGIGPSSEDYYPTVVVHALIKILKDPSLTPNYTSVITAFMHLFKALGLKCVSFLPQIIPIYLSTIRNSPAGSYEFYFQQLGTMVSIVKQHIRNYLKDIFSL